MITSSRRIFIKGVAAFCAFAASGINRVWAAWPKAAFDAKDMKELDAALYAGKAADKTDKIDIRLPEIAENGGQVPITVVASIPDTEVITIIAEGNPRPLVARFMITKQGVPTIGTRMKLAKTQNITVIAEAGGKTYKATKEIKVSIGGCGG
jgi:sulfur-oxidizing protein SoxY